MAYYVNDAVREAVKKYHVHRLLLFGQTGVGSCPLRCTYCFLRKDQPRKFMSIQTLHDAIDWLRDVAVDTPGIHWFGTEPLMSWDLIVESRRYAPEMEISMTTNGYLLTPERIKWLAENKIKIYIYSIDGGEEHNSQRITRAGKPSWKRVAQNLKLVLQEPWFAEHLCARGTWSPTDYDLVGRFKALEELGARYITFIPTVHTPWDEEKVAQAYMELAEHYKGGPSPSRMINEMLDRIATGPKTHPGNGCGVGHGSWALSPDGKLSICQAFEEEPKGTIGSIYEGITNPDAFKITEAVDHFKTKERPYPKPECKTCHAWVHCQGTAFCGHENFRTTGNPAIPPEGYCQHLRGEVTGLKYWLSLRQKNDPNSQLNQLFSHIGKPER